MKKSMLAVVTALGLGFGLPAASSAQFVLYVVSDPPNEPAGVCAGPDGAEWFTVANRVGRITLDGATTTLELPTPDAGPGDILAGADGNLWFLERDASKIGRVTPSGTITEFPIPGSARPLAIGLGPEGAIWFTDLQKTITRVTYAGSFFEYALPTDAYSLAAGSDGNLWFTAESPPALVGKMTANGDVTMVATPLAAWSLASALGSDGNIWFTTVGPAFGRVTAAGALTLFSLSSDRGHQPTSIALGPDRELWMPVDETFFCIPPCDLPPEKDGVLRVGIDGSQARYELPPEMAISDGSKIAPGPDGSMWLTARGGLVLFFPAQVDPRRPPARVIAPRR